MSKKAKQITLRVDLVEPLIRKWEKEKKYRSDVNQKFSGYVNDILGDILEKDEFLQKYAPMLSLEGYSYNCLYIKDEKRHATAEIYRHDNQIKCALDDSFECEHVHFALAIPEVAKLGLKNS
ncbi:MAG: hypothetical protein AB1351_12245 [Thermoproteota archaeon]